MPSIVSDDGDIVDAQYPPMNQPSTSQEPLIRQAVGFSWNIPSSSVNSYSASPPGTAPPQFLPGQSVEPLPQSQTRETERRKKSSKPREPGTSRSKSHKDKSRHQGYDAPTGSRAFRVEGYVNEPSHPGPPRSPPSGPYRSDYRAEGSPPLVRSRGKSRPQREESSVPPNVPSSQRSQSQRQPRHHDDYEGDPISSQPPRERDYVSQESHSFYAGSHSSATFTDSQSPARSHRVYKNRSSRRPEPDPTSSQPTPRTSDRYSRPLRIVTLLIEDRRPGQAIDQLAEVRVPLREMQYPEDGFWADAKEICDELQASPSRIDGNIFSSK